MKRILLFMALVLGLCIAHDAHAQNLTVKITQTNGTTTTVTGKASLQAALTGHTLGQVKALEISAGNFVTTDWTWLKTNRTNLNALQDFTIQETIGSVADIPNTTTHTEPYFNPSSLKTLNVAKVAKIGEYAFSYCTALTTATFPQATSIGYWAFVSCSSLTTVNIPKAKYIGNSAFHGCDSLRTATFPQATSIGDGAFTSCDNLRTATFPKATSIGGWAFHGCDLTTVNFPKATSIGNGAFGENRSLTTASFPQVDSIGTEAFMNDVSLNKLYLGATPPSVLPYLYTFSGCPDLRYLVLTDANGNPLEGEDFSIAKQRYIDDNPMYYAPGTWHEWTIETVVNNVIIDPSITNGTLTATPNNGVENGALVSLTARPAAGYRLKAGSLRAYKTGNASVTVPITDNKFYMPANDVTVTCEFEAYTVTVDPGITHGTLTASPSSNVPSGTTVRLTTTPATGYKLKAGSLRAYRTGSPNTAVAVTNGTFTMPAYDVTVTCEFEAILYTVTVDPGISHGTLTASPSSNVTYGTTVRLTTTPATGYKLKAGSLRAYRTGSPNTAVAVTNGTFTMPAYDVTVTCEFEAILYTVTVDPGITHGTLTASPNSNVTYGTTVRLTTTPSTGYKLKAGSLRAYRTGSPNTAVAVTDGTFTMPAYDVTVTCEFEAILYTVTVEDGITHGTLTASPNSNVTYGTTVRLTTTPSTGYKLKAGSLRAYRTGSPNTAVAVTNGTFTMPAYDVTVTCEFEAILYTVTVDPGISHGTLTASPNSNVTYGTTVRLTTTPATGYKLKAGSLRAYRTGSPNTAVAVTNGTFTMPAYDVTVTCEFEAILYTVTVDPGITHGTLTASPNSNVTYGTTVRLTTTPATGYKLKAGSLRAYRTGSPNTAVAVTNGTFTMPAYDVTVTCEFEAILYTVTVDPGITHGTLTASPNSNVTYGTTVRLTTTPATGYKLKAGSLRAYRTGSPNTAVAVTNGTFTMPAYDVTVTCEFEAILYTVTVDPGITHGTLTASPSSNVPSGTTVRLTTTPATGYKLKAGSLRAYRTGSPNTAVAVTDGTFTMPAYDVTVTCEFEAILYTVTVDPGITHGTLTATPNNDVLYGTTVRLTTTPATGYKLKAGSLRAYKTGSPNTAVAVTNGTFTMPAYDVTLTCEFEAILYTVTVDPGITHGTLTATPNNNVTYGTTVSLTARPAPGYKLKAGSLRAYKTGSPNTAVAVTNGTFTMPAYDVTVTCEFEAITYTWVQAVTSQPAGWDPMNIDSPEDLAWFISFVNGYNGCAMHPTANARITADLDMSAYQWLPIGSQVSMLDPGRDDYYSSPIDGYHGKFDGGYHAIKGLRNDSEVVSRPGLFDKIVDGIVQKVIVADCDFHVPPVQGSPVMYFGILANETFAMNGDCGIFFCEVSGKLTDDGESLSQNIKIGGLVGRVGAGSNVHSCISLAMLKSRYMGGLVAELDGGLYNCYTYPLFKLLDNGSHPVAGSCWIINNTGFMSNVYIREREPVDGYIGFYALCDYIINHKQSSRGCLADSDRKIPDIHENKRYYYYPADFMTLIVPDSKKGRGYFTPTETPYMYRHADNKVSKVDPNDPTMIYIGDATDRNFVDVLNAWVDDHQNEAPDGLPYARWSRTCASPVNDDYPVLLMPGANAVASDGDALYYGDVNDLLLKNLDTPSLTDDAVFLYDDAKFIKKTTMPGAYYSGKEFYIGEGVCVLPEDPNSNTIPNGPAKTHVGVTFDNSASGWDWHLFSSSLTNAPLGIDYGGDNTPHQFSWDDPGVQYNFYDESVQDGFFPSKEYGTGANYYEHWDFYTYDEPSYHFINFKRNSNSHWHQDGNHANITYANEKTLLQGKGYMMAIDQPTFMQAKGELNNTYLSYPLTHSAEINPGYNLVGNPFQAILDFDAVAGYQGNFSQLGDNMSYTTYDADKGGYVSYVSPEGGSSSLSNGASTGAISASRYISPLQGFFVHVPESTPQSSATFINFAPWFCKMRADVDNTYQGFRGGEEPAQPTFPLVNLIATDDNGKNDILVVEFDRPENGGARKMIPIRSGKGSLYARHQDENMSIAFVEEGITEIPVRFETIEDAVFTMTSLPANGPFRYLHLIDNITGIDHDLLADSTFTFEAKVSDYKSRFKLVMALEAVEEPGDDVIADQFAYYDGGTWIVEAKGDMEVYDLTGRLMLSKHLANAQNSIDLSGLSVGVYLMRVSNGSDAKMQKIVVE